MGEDERAGWVKRLEAFAEQHSARLEDVLLGDLKSVRGPLIHLSR